MVKTSGVFDVYVALAETKCHLPTACTLGVAHLAVPRDEVLLPIEGSPGG